VRLSKPSFLVLRISESQKLDQAATYGKWTFCKNGLFVPLLNYS